MKVFISFIFVSAVNAVFSQAYIPAASIFNKLGDKDSVVLYQCHVENVVQVLQTASGQTITGAEREGSITDKFVIRKDGALWNVKHYTSALNVLPNRKFSGLKIRERSYWNFVFQKSVDIGEQQMRMLCAIESNGRETTEYDFTVSTYTRNQIIIKKGKKFKQFLPEQNWVILQLPGF